MNGTIALITEIILQIFMHGEPRPKILIVFSDKAANPTGREQASLMRPYVHMNIFVLQSDIALIGL